MRKKQKHHTDELKSVWNLAMRSDWLTLELYCFIILFMNDRQKINCQKVKHKHNESATQQLIFMGCNYSSLAETFEFSWSFFTEEHNTLP